MSDVEQRTKEVVARVLKVDINTIKPESRFVEDLGAESIQSIELMAAFEEEFDIEIDEEGAMQVKTVGAAATFNEKALAEQKG